MLFDFGLKYVSLEILHCFVSAETFAKIVFELEQSIADSFEPIFFTTFEIPLPESICVQKL
jgi:hypothetical protein